jgi:hypothetical protein
MRFVRRRQLLRTHAGAIRQVIRRTWDRSPETKSAPPVTELRAFPPPGLPNLMEEELRQLFPEFVECAGDGGKDKGLQFLVAGICSGVGRSSTCQEREI